jgi:hypothetical protein
LYVLGTVEPATKRKSSVFAAASDLLLIQREGPHLYGEAPEQSFTNWIPSAGEIAMPIRKRIASRVANESDTRTKLRVVAPSDTPVEEIVEPTTETQDLKVLMVRTLDHRNRASEALARLRSLQQTVFTAAAAGRSDVERKMEAALEEYRSARFGAQRARQRLLAGLTSDESY